mmetsp:Transcript_24996/g.70151  ORF Transcript_24996/g.70151 Transcript_24996/m.70151 type:complete len:905 (-) Transcript_24996:133-2847(-)|eukprot:CAMPEP_0119560034 /NCGR_PEP_ID=MMETSP1352-20130426/13840_1 /TAXON_ID=265584 /ORGANISM="Stauroneis constricta, Strain CCMP1120" /LENGTH=904 /DNA_ID=CAMNT_0007607899 /DNA_START=279 /DNA_END=2993 /DNA_ORIENTATION=+
MTLAAAPISVSPSSITAQLTPASASTTASQSSLSQPPFSIAPLTASPTQTQAKSVSPAASELHPISILPPLLSPSPPQRHRAFATPHHLLLRKQQKLEEARARQQQQAPSTRLSLRRSALLYDLQRRDSSSSTLLTVHPLSPRISRLRKRQRGGQEQLEKEVRSPSGNPSLASDCSSAPSSPSRSSASIGKSSTSPAIFLANAPAPGIMNRPLPFSEVNRPPAEDCVADSRAKSQAQLGAALPHQAEFSVRRATTNATATGAATTSCTSSCGSSDSDSQGAATLTKTPKGPPSHPSSSRRKAGALAKSPLSVFLSTQILSEPSISSFTIVPDNARSIVASSDRLGMDDSQHRRRNSCPAFGTDGIEGVHNKVLSPSLPVSSFGLTSAELFASSGWPKSSRGNHLQNGKTSAVSKAVARWQTGSPSTGRSPRVPIPNINGNAAAVTAATLPYSALPSSSSALSSSSLPKAGDAILGDDCDGNMAIQPPKRSLSSDKDIMRSGLDSNGENLSMQGSTRFSSAESSSSISTVPIHAAGRARGTTATTSSTGGTGTRLSTAAHIALPPSPPFDDGERKGTNCKKDNGNFPQKPRQRPKRDLTSSRDLPPILSHRRISFQNDHDDDNNDDENGCDTDNDIAIDPNDGMASGDGPRSWRKTKKQHFEDAKRSSDIDGNDIGRDDSDEGGGKSSSYGGINRNQRPGEPSFRDGMVSNASIGRSSQLANYEKARLAADSIPLEEPSRDYSCARQPWQPGQHHHQTQHLRQSNSTSNLIPQRPTLFGADIPKKPSRKKSPSAPALEISRNKMEQDPTMFAHPQYNPRKNQYSSSNPTFLDLATGLVNHQGSSSIELQIVDATERGDAINGERERAKISPYENEDDLCAASSLTRDIVEEAHNIVSMHDGSSLG